MSTIDLARELISVGRRVVLVDLDLRRPELAAQLGVVPGRDLLDVTRRSDPLADALHQVQGEPLLRLAGPTSMLDPRKLEQFEARLPIGPVPRTRRGRESADTERLAAGRDHDGVGAQCAFRGLDDTGACDSAARLHDGDAAIAV